MAQAESGHGAGLAPLLERDGLGNAFEYEVDALGCATLTSCTAAVDELAVPARLGGAAVTRIGDEAFASARSVTGARGAAQLDTQAVAAFASGKPLARNGSLRRVGLPEGLVSIGRGAFRGCARLAAVDLPATLEEIEDYAFSCTDVRCVDIPRACVRLAPQALRTGPEALPGIRSYYRSKLERIRVHPENPVFCMRGGMLCRRVGGQVGLEALLCPGCAEEVDLSCGIGLVLPSAFAGTGHVGALTVGCDTVFADDAGVLPNGRCERLSLQYRDGRGGMRALPLRLPADPVAARRLFDATRERGCVDAARVAAAYDAVLADLKDPLEQSTLMLGRLADPVFLEPERERAFRGALDARFEALCLHFGARGRWECFELMADAGLLDAGSAGRAVDVLSEAGDAAAVRCVLKLKRDRFEQAGWDYGL